MKVLKVLLAVLALLAAISSTHATVGYVNVNSTNPTPPYTSWATAATNIQDAVDVAAAGDTIMVTNGTYAAGGRAVGTNGLVNRVAVTKPLAVRSVNGPQFTLIQGRQVTGTTNGISAIRCVYLTNGASLSGFTLTNGATRSGGDYDRDRSGGGVWCESTNVVITNCTLTGNSASSYGGGACYGTLTNCTLTGNSAGSFGGGAYYGTLNNCTLVANSSSYGGGAYYGTLNNCTLTGNSASWGGGVNGGNLHNCIVYFNSAPFGANFYGGSLSYCCTTPLPGGGTGNLDQDPQLASASHLSLGSPCRGAGRAAYAKGLDIDGEAWASPPSIGCDEYRDGEVTGPLTVRVRAAFTNVAVGFAVALTAEIEGRASASAWAFGDGVVVMDQPYASHAWTTPGDYVVVLMAFNESQPGGVSATQTVHVLALPVHYVASGSSNPQPPYTSWATAARTIQEAVDAATSAGALVLVTNGIYATGGRAVYSTMTNRVAVTKPLAVRSVNGPQFTLIQGRQVPGITNGSGAIRCVYLTNGASLSGFTLTNGATLNQGGVDSRDANGGGVWCEMADAVITNCTLTGNSANWDGGGAYYGTFNNCTLTGNSAADRGGGVYLGNLYNCTLTGNFVLGISAACFGGGVSDSTLNNCVLTGNSAPNGGGANSGTLNNCTLTANSATYGGGAYLADLYNCIVYFNSAVEGANYDGGSLNYCCTTPLPGGGTGNLDQDPQLASASHLSLGSPCRGAGRAAYARGLDIDGEAWASPPSIGCDEYRDGEVTGPLTVRVRAAFTNVAVGFAVGLTAEIEGRTSASAWAFGDGLAASNRPYASHAWTAPGDYAVVLTALNESQPGGVSATQTIHVLALPVHYVASGSSDPQPPYTNWATAARTIQEAVDAATSAGALVLVTNGIYADGGRAVYTTMTNRVAVTKPLTLRSVNGPQFTLIQGRQVPGSTNGTGAIRCVYLTNGASLSGFTLTNGATRILGDSDHEASGGGVWCELADAVITNCTLTGNSAFSSGGGVYWGTLYNCTLTANSADFGGGAYNGRLNNCIVYFNTGSSSGPNYFVATLNYCCTTPLPAGVGNITNTPLFVDQIGQNYRLQSSSPCIDAGLNTYAGGPTDLDGNPRIVNGTVDMGAYEFQLLRGVDIGLRLFDGSATKRIACEPSGPGGVLLSSLRIAKNGTNYGILLVATNALDASRLQIQTPTGIKALKKLP